jgi:hypothetical protein
MSAVKSGFVTGVDCCGRGVAQSTTAVVPGAQSVREHRPVTLVVNAMHLMTASFVRGAAFMVWLQQHLTFQAPGAVLTELTAGVLGKNVHIQLSVHCVWCRCCQRGGTKAHLPVAPRIPGTLHEVLHSHRKGQPPTHSTPHRACKYAPTQPTCPRPGACMYRTRTHRRSCAPYAAALPTRCYTAHSRPGGPLAGHIPHNGVLPVEFIFPVAQVAEFHGAQATQVVGAVRQLGGQQRKSARNLVPRKRIHACRSKSRTRRRWGGLVRAWRICNPRCVQPPEAAQCIGMRL